MAQTRAQHGVWFQQHITALFADKTPQQQYAAITAEMAALDAKGDALTATDAWTLEKLEDVQAYVHTYLMYYHGIDASQLTAA